MAPAYEQAAAEVRAASSRNIDETSWGKDWDKLSERHGKRIWLWVAACETAAVFAVHARRNRKGLRNVLGADRWS